MKRKMLALLAFLPLDLGAQATNSDSVAQRRWCWRGRPAPRCAWILLTEFGFERPFTSTRTSVEWNSAGDTYFEEAFDDRATIAGGLLRTVGARAAVGGVATWGVANEDRKSLEVRYRRYVDGYSSIDLSGGVLSTTVQPYRPIGHGATMAVGLTWADLVGAHARVDVVRAEGRAYNSIAGGAHLGQRAGVAAGIVLGIAFAIINAAL